MSWQDFFPIDDDDERRITRGNEVRLLTDDDRAVHTIWRAIDRAEERVWLSIYLLAPDEVGLGTLERMERAARRGCEVLFVYDAFTSRGLRPRHLAGLRAAGGRAAAFNPWWPPWKEPGLLGTRNHRKLLVTDHEAAICGGLNLSEDYAGHEFGPWTFDDTVAYLRGPAVSHLGDVFLRTWHEVTGEARSGSFDLHPLPDDLRVEVLETDPRRPSTRLRETLRRALERCSVSCRLVTPYFLPEEWLSQALSAATARGADVRVLTAGKTDNVLARAAGRHCYGPLLEAGVHIYELFGRVLHAKSLAIDGTFGSIGSYNLDLWTARHALDVNIAVLDGDFAHSLERDFDHFLRNASQFTPEEYRKRGLPSRLVDRASLLLARKI